MAFSSADIETIKAAVPERFRPDPVQGRLLINSFGAVAELRSATLIYEGETSDSSDPLVSDRARDMAGMALADDPDATAAFVLTGAQLARRAEAERERAEERRKEDTAFAEIRAALDARLAALDAELAEIDKRLDEIRERRDELAERMDALDDLDTLIKSGKLDPNNPAHAALLRRAGIDPAKTRREDIGDAVTQRRREVAGEDDALDSEWNARMKRRGEVVRDREKVQAARDEIEHADTPEAMERAERRARTVLGSQQLGEAAYQTDSQRAKAIAANAVGVSAKSEDYNRQAAQEDDSKIANASGAAFKLGG